MPKMKPTDEALLMRLQRMAADKGLNEQRMFGGMCFMDRGNMVGGIAGDEVVLRLGREDAAVAIAEDGVRYCDFTGRIMKTMVLVEPSAQGDDETLSAWFDRALAFTHTLPAKS